MRASQGTQGGVDSTSGQVMSNAGLLGDGQVTPLRRCRQQHSSATAQRALRLCNTTCCNAVHQGATRYKIVQRAMLQRDATQVVGVADTGVKADECFFRDASVAVPYNTVNQAHRKIVQCGPPTGSAARVIYVRRGCIGYSRVLCGPPQLRPSLTPRDGPLRIPISDKLCLFCLAVPVGKLSAFKPFVCQVYHDVRRLIGLQLRAWYT